MQKKSVHVRSWYEITDDAANRIFASVRMNYRTMKQVERTHRVLVLSNWDNKYSVGGWVVIYGHEMKLRYADLLHEVAPTFLGWKRVAQERKL